MRTTALLFLLIFSGLGTGSAQVFNTAKLDSLFDILAQKDQAMGSLAISRDGALVYQRAIGYRLISGKDSIPANTQTHYRIGSISKMFTATMIFQLVESKKLTLDETLDQFFPVIPNAAEITIGHLLYHRSGIHNFTNDSTYMTYNEQPLSQEEIMAIIAEGGSDFEPDTKAAYSNSNYVILGFIVEKVTGKSYANQLEKQITDKLKLKDTYVGGKIDPGKEEAYSYFYMGSWNQYTETDMSIPGGAGAIVSTPTDLVKFIEGLFSGKLVSNESLEKMKTFRDNYGMGMFQVPFYDQAGFGHNGSIDAFMATLSYFPEDKVAVAYCSNGMVYPMNEILIGALSVVYDRAYTVPTFKTIALKPEELDQYIGVYSSDAFPLKLTVTRQDKSLFAQATGQMPIPLEATALDKFKFDPAGILIDFDRGKNELTLRQGGGSYVFVRE